MATARHHKTSIEHGLFDEARRIFIIPATWLDEEASTTMLLKTEVPVYVSESEDLKPAWPAIPLRTWLAAREAAKLAIFNAQHR